jgi:hypothetical protein
MGGIGYRPTCELAELASVSFNFLHTEVTDMFEYFDVLGQAELAEREYVQLLDNMDREDAEAYAVREAMAIDGEVPVDWVMELGYLEFV